MSLKPIKKVDVNQIEEPPVKLREMDEDMVRSLVMSIEEAGYVEPIQVVETPEGKYRIVNGWHRFVVLRDVFKAKEVDVIVVGRLCSPGEKSDCIDEFDYWLNAIRFNSIHGKWVRGALSEVMKQLIEIAKQRGMSEKLLKEKLGFHKSISQSKPRDEKSLMAKRICSEIARLGTEELGAGVIAFTYKGKMVLLVPLEKDTYAMLSLLIERLSGEGKTLGDWIGEQLSRNDGD